MKKRVAILISGRGSNMEALIRAAEAPDYPAEIVGVLSNRADAAGLAFAAAAGIATAVCSHKDFTGREAFDAALSGARPGERQGTIVAAEKVGRNEPCPCGSGKKYKKCHGEAA